MIKTHISPFQAGEADWRSVFTTPWYSMARRGDWYSVMTTSEIHPATVFAVDSQERVLLLEVYRPALDRVVLETPRGLVEPGETSRQGAAREFVEETGIAISHRDLVPLGYVFPDSGILRTEIAVFGLRHDAPFVPVSADDAEILGYRLVPLSQISELIGSGEIADAILISAWQRFMAGRNPSRNGRMVEVEILDCEGNVVTTLDTPRPSWTFDEYVRNRDAAGWSWRIVKP